MGAAGGRAREVEGLARRVLNVLGARPTRVEGSPSLESALRANGVPLSLANADELEASSLCLLAQGGEGSPGWLENALRSAPESVARALVVVPRGPRTRAEYERAAFAAGYRRHPLTLLVQPYGSLEYEPEQLELWLERIPSAALGRYPQDSLRQERDLHMDMLRESGRRADAHLARYQLAVSYVRPNDVVLDVACGLGYGSALLWDASPASRVIGVDDSAFATDYARDNFASTRPGLEYRQGDACDLSALPDASVDVVVSFETIEHLREPERFLAEAHRVLTPGGRLIGSVPYLWVDETGEDPNPFHFHVFDLARLKSLCGRYFLHEQFFGQDAGGGMTRSQAHRRLWELADPDSEPATEWLLYVGLKDPVGTRVAYRESIYPLVAPERSLTSFARDYENPWLVRSMVSIGMRARNQKLLADLATRTLNHASPHSADAGAALAVLAYRSLEGGSIQDPGELWRKILDYVEQPAGNPHVERWRISLRYVLALRELNITGGNPRGLFRQVAEADALAFSPHLATKTVGAAFREGWLNFTANDLKAARAAWKRGLAAARDALHARWEDQVGSEEDPPLFALRELVAVADEASRCANGLNLTTRSEGREHLVSAQIFHSPLLEAEELRRELERLLPFEEENPRLRIELETLRAAEALARSERDEARKGAEWLEEQRGRWERTAGELKTWADQQSRQIEAAQRDHEARVAQLEAELSRLREAEARLRRLEQFLPLQSLRFAANRLFPADSLRAELAQRLARTFSRRSSRQD